MLWSGQGPSGHFIRTAAATAIDHHDDNAGAFFLKWALRVLTNYTLGMFFAVIRFLFQLGSIVWSYSPNFGSGMLFFAVASFAAVRQPTCGGWSVTVSGPGTEGHIAQGPRPAPRGPRRAGAACRASCPST